MKSVLAALLLAAAPQRIVSTSPSITEILFALGLGDRVVGVTTFCRHPPEAQKKAKIGSFIQPDLETVAALRPDLVIIQKNPVQLGEKLGRLGLRSMEVDFPSVDQTLTAIERIAGACGQTGRGAQLAASLREQLSAVRRAVGLRRRTTLAFVVGRNPNAIDGLFAAGAKSYLTDLIDIAGGANVYADATGSYPRVTLESLLERNPDVIIDTAEMGDLARLDDAGKRRVVALWGRQTALKAVREHRVYALSDEALTKPGPRMALAAQALARLLDGVDGK